MPTTRPSKDLSANSVKKDEERLWLQHVLDRFQVQVKIENAECPDFFFEIGSQRIGVEVTVYHNDTKACGSPGRMRYEIWWKLASQIKIGLEAAGMKDIHGTVFFNETAFKSIQAIDANQFVSEIVSFCKSLGPDIKCLDVVDIGSPYLKGKLEKIHVDKVDAKVMSIVWWCANLQSGVIPNPIPLLQEIVKGKVAKGKGYDWKTAVGKWLVVVAPAFDCSTTGIISDRAPVIRQGKLVPMPSINDNNTESKGIDVENKVFDRIYYWDWFSEKIWELYPCIQVVFEPVKGEAILHKSKLPIYLKQM